MLLRECKYDFNILTGKEHITVVIPGSEFCDIKTIEKVWKHHKDWNNMKASTKYRFSDPCAESPTEDTQLADLDPMLSRGNQPFALMEYNMKAVQKL